MLDERHRRAVSAFLKGMNKTNALKEAGYSDSFIKNQGGHSIFKRPDVIKEIERRQNIMSTKAEVDANWVISRLKSIADANLNDILVPDEEGVGKIDLRKLTPDLKRALVGYNVDGLNGTRKMTIKLSDKLRALEMLARHLGLFNDRLELEGEMSLVERLQEGRKRSSGGKDSQQT